MHECDTLETTAYMRVLIAQVHGAKMVIMRSLDSANDLTKRAQSRSELKQELEEARGGGRAEPPPPAERDLGRTSACKSESESEIPSGKTVGDGGCSPPEPPARICPSAAREEERRARATPAPLDKAVAAEGLSS